MAMQVTANKKTLEPDRSADALESSAVIDKALARRKASNFVAETLGERLIGGDPVLFSGKRLIWRVPILLTSPKLGKIGEVGAVEIDAVTAEILVDELQLQILKTEAIELARRTTSRTG